MSTADTEPTAAEKLQDRLNDPAVAESLTCLLDRIDIVSFAVESLDGLVRRGEVIADSVSEGFAEVRNSDTAEALELLQKTPEILRTSSKLVGAAAELDSDALSQSHVLAKLTDPQTLQTLNSLLERLPLIAFTVEALESFLQRGETIADNMSEAVGQMELTAKDIDISKLLMFLEALPTLTEAGEKILNSELMNGVPAVIEAGVSMIDSGMLDQQVVSTLGDLGKKGAETYRDVASKPVEPVGGLFATLKATKDPDVQKTVGFFFAFAKAFAKHLK